MRSAADMMDDNCIALFAAIVNDISAEKAIELVGLSKPSPHAKGSTVRKTRNAEIVRLVKEGVLVADIAKQMGIVKTTVYEALHEAGIFLRKKKW